MYYESQHRPTQKRSLLRNRIAGVAAAASSTFITGVTVGAPARAAGSVWDAVAARESTGNWAVKLAADGVMGPMTTRAIQRWVGTTADGVFGPVSRKSLQHKVGATPDGAIGQQTIRALRLGSVLHAKARDT